MDIIETVRADLKEANMARQYEVADASGVPWSTLRKIIDGDTENPRYDTIKRLLAYYEKRATDTPDPSPSRAVA